MLKAFRMPALTALAVFTIPSAAQAVDIPNTVVVTDIDAAPLPAGESWATLPGENTGTAEITTTAARSGNGSIELTGDRTRVQTGYQYDGAAGGASNLGLLRNVLGLTFDWMVAPDSVNALGPNYTPALRLLIQDGTARSELIWEGAYNGVAVTPGEWNTTNTYDAFWRWAGGVTFENGAQVNQTIGDWAISGYYSADAFVSAISVGAGGSAGAGYHAFVDNVVYSRAMPNEDNVSLTTTYNFEATAAVPEPATWMLMIAGFGAVGATMRRKRKSAIGALAAA